MNIFSRTSKEKYFVIALVFIILALILQLSYTFWDIIHCDLKHDGMYRILLKLYKCTAASWLLWLLCLIRIYKKKNSRFIIIIIFSLTLLYYIIVMLQPLDYFLRGFASRFSIFYMCQNIILIILSALTIYGIIYNRYVKIFIIITTSVEIIMSIININLAFYMRDYHSWINPYYNLVYVSLRDLEFFDIRFIISLRYILTIMMQLVSCTAIILITCVLPRTPEEELKMLKAKCDKGKINTSDYERQRSDILKKI